MPGGHVRAPVDLAQMTLQGQIQSGGELRRLLGNPPEKLILAGRRSTRSAI